MRLFVFITETEEEFFERSRSIYSKTSTLTSGYYRNTSNSWNYSGLSMHKAGLTKLKIKRIL